MGVPTGGARGSISVNASQLAAARATVNAFATGVNTSMAGMNPGINKAQSAIGGLSASIGQLGISFGAVQLGRFVLETDAVATSYRRQSVAALSLAGSQGKLNSLLEAYDKATGGAIDKAQALADVTKLQAVGFADSAEELTTFARAARGISVAMGSSQDYVISQLQLAIANQSTLRLDQLGLGVSEVKQRIDQLKAANKGLTTEMLYQNAILELAEEKFGALADSAEAQATGLENLKKAGTNFKLAFGQLGGEGSTSPGPFQTWADDINKATAEMQTFSLWAEKVRYNLGLSTFNPVANALDDRAENAATMGASIRSRAGRAASRFDEDQTSLIRDWAASVKDIERSSNAERLSAKRSYEESVSSTERDYGKMRTREAQDFATSRARAEKGFADSIADLHRDASRREADQAEDFARANSEAQSNSAERVADARKDSNERLLEMERDYAKDRERAQADHRDRLMDAAGRLDAKAVYEEQRNFARQEEEAKEAHDEQRDDLNKALAERVADEQESLAESNQQRQEAYDRQLADARENDALREADMIADFEARKVLEDEDRALKLARAAEDYAANVAEMARQHALELEQIGIQEAEKRSTLQTEFEKAMAEQGIMTDAWIAENKRLTDAAIADYDRATQFIAFAAKTAAAAAQGRSPSWTADPYVDRPMVPGSSLSSPRGSGGSSRNISVAPGAIVIYGDGLNEQQVANKVLSMFEGLMN